MSGPGWCAGDFTALLWDDAQGVYDAILAHPFLAGLTTGELAEDRFGHYVVQDAHYLRDYARALAVLSGQAPDPSAARLLASHAANALDVERTLHAELFAGLDGVTVTQGPPGPTTVAYTSYLLATVRGGAFPEGLAAVLPCYWIYWRVGVALAGVGSPHPAYARWIASYGGDDFAVLARPVIALTEQTAAQAGAATRARMRSHHLTAARFEWMFWDAAYRREAWPV